MRGVSRKLQFLKNFLTRRKPESDDGSEEKWIADFGKGKNIRFEINSESSQEAGASYDAGIRKNLFYAGHSLVLGLKKTGLFAWVEAPEHRYRDFFVSATIRIDAKGGYGAGGLLFRMVDSGTYYSLLISSKGYFRLDALRNGMPLPLIGWTELPLSSGSELSPDESVDFSVAAYGSHILLVIRGRWAAEINDSSIQEGSICLAAACYESGEGAYRVTRDLNDVSYNTEVFLEAITLDSRITEVTAFYEKWHDSPDIDPKARIRLAETFTAMDQHSAALVQIRKAWDTPLYRKTQKELLLAGRLAQILGLASDAEGYISQCFEMDVESPEGREALAEMAKILYVGKRFPELKNYCAEALKIKPEDSMLWAFQGHAYWNLESYKKAAMSYKKAFNLDRNNGIIAKNAANVYDVMNLKSEALLYYIEAGKAFLKDSNYTDLGLLVPKLLSLGKENHEARSLAGKWAFAVEDWKMAEEEFENAEKLRKAMQPKPKRDGAQVFLEALLLLRNGKRQAALPLLKKAAALEKNYALFRFRLAENLFLLDDNPDNPQMLKELNAALALCEESPQEDAGLTGWVNNFAAQAALRKGELEAAAKHLDKASEILGTTPAVQVNRATLFYLQGSLDKALELLSAEKKDDPDGIMANCAGNLLVRSKRFEEADEKYRTALAASPDNIEYLFNRASCLIELHLFGEADELLARAHSLAPSPSILEMISYVAAKKGEYARAEQACRAALEMDPDHAPSLLSLGWVFSSTGRHKEVFKIIERLNKLPLDNEAAKGLKDLELRLDEHYHRKIECDACERFWKVPKECPPVPAIRLYAMPPDDLPAGSCPACGKTYCIGCAKNSLDPSGRFICLSCGRSLKVINEGLKKIVRDWALKSKLTTNGTNSSSANCARTGR